MGAILVGGLSTYTAGAQSVDVDAPQIPDPSAALAPTLCPKDTLPEVEALSLRNRTIFYGSSDGDGTTGVTIGFRDQLEMYRVEGSRALVQTVGNDRQCGWVDKKRILVGRERRRVGDDPDAETLETARKGRIKNPLFVKALIRSNVALKDRGTRDLYKAKSVTIYDGPSVQANEKGQIGIFSIFFIYSQERDRSGGTWYYIAGTDPYDKGLAGWVREANVFLWHSQIALYFSDRSSENLSLYPDKVSAVDGTPGREFSRRPANYREPVGTNIARFPVLGDQDGEDDRTLYRIAHFSKLCPEGKSESECLTRAQASQQRHDFARVRKLAGNVDILFVIDATESMRPYFRPIVQGVRDALEEAKKRADKGRRGSGTSRIRVAAAVYGDYKSSRADADNMDFELIDFADEGGWGNLRQLRNVGRRFSDKLRDRPEAGFAAIRRAATNASWRQDTSARIVFWIGDAGNRAAGDNETLTAQDIAAALKFKRVTMFQAINVRGKTDRGWQWHEDFIRQAKEINGTDDGDPNNDRFAGFAPALTYQRNAKRENTRAQVAQFIGIAVRAPLAAKACVEQQGRCLDEPRRPVAPPPTATAPAGQGPTAGKVLPEAEIVARERKVMEAILRANNITSSQAIERFFQYKQLMTDAWVQVEPDAENVRFWIAMDDRRVGELQKFLDRTCRTLTRSRDVSRNIERLLEELVETFGGDYDARDTVIDNLNRIFFLPKKHFSTVLDRTARDLDRYWKRVGRKAEGARFRGSICKSAQLFEYVVKRKRIRPNQLEAPGALKDKWQPKADVKPEDFDWQWNLENGISYFYIPVEFFPGDIETAAQ
ncbi:MAG: hypothetical protein AAFR04_14605 [Pseudomonadota bacterium]